jgi:hypothetical protein
VRLAKSKLLLFALVKYAGAAYLCFLAWKMWTAPVEFDAASLPPGQSPWRMFTAGMLVTLGNPKIMMFYPEEVLIPWLALQLDRTLGQGDWIEAGQHSGRTEEQVRLDVERDKYFSAEEAKDYGIVDEVLTSLKRRAEVGSS